MRKLVGKEYFPDMLANKYIHNVNLAYVIGT